MCSVSHYWSWQPTNSLVISVFLITADDDHEDDYDGRPLTMRMVTMSMTMAHHSYNIDGGWHRYDVDIFQFHKTTEIVPFDIFSAPASDTYMMVSGSQFLASRSKLKVRRCPYYCGRSQTSSKVWPSQFPISHLRSALVSHLLQLPPRQIKHNAPRKKRLSADCHKYRDKLRSTLTTTKIKSFTQKTIFHNNAQDLHIRSNKQISIQHPHQHVPQIKKEFGPHIIFL